MADINWTKIRNYYINHNISQKALAKRYGVSYGSIAQKSIDEGWIRRKKEQHEKISERLAQKSAERIASREDERDAEVDRLKKDIRVEIFRQIVKRIGADDLDGQDFRRLVQNYSDMMAIEPETAEKHSEAFEELLRSVEAPE